jgi:uncharacterized protein
MDLLMTASDFLRGEGDVLLAYAFGSVAEGRAHRESDLDLAVLLDWDRIPSRDGRGRRQIELIAKLVGALGFNEVDLVLLNDAPPLLAREIVRRGALLHAVDAETVHAFERDVQLRAADIEPFIQRHRARLLEVLRS